MCLVFLPIDVFFLCNIVVKTVSLRTLSLSFYPIQTMVLNNTYLTPLPSSLDYFCGLDCSGVNPSYAYGTMVAWDSVGLTTTAQCSGIPDNTTYL